MAETRKDKEKKRRWWQRLSFKKLNKRYYVLMSHNESMAPIVDFKVNLLRLVIVTLCLIVFLMIITAIVIAFTPLREYIPGYNGNASLEREVYALSRRADSIEREMDRKDVYFKNLKLVVEGYDFSADSLEQRDIYAPLLGFDIDTIEIRKSVQDSALRAAFEEANRYNLRQQSNLVKHRTSYGAANFFAPLTGDIIRPYEPSEGHYGVDIAAPENQVIKAVLDGTVVVASWTLDFGYTLGIQHENNYFSTYKHNAVLLKKEGDYVKAGEAIAVLGASGEDVAEPQLHFELWRNGMSLNPQDYINFKTEN